MAKSIVLSVRVPEKISSSLDIIASHYQCSTSRLVNAVLTSFCLEYSKSMVENFSVPDEDASSIE